MAAAIVRVDVEPSVVDWALDRAGISPDELDETTKRWVLNRTSPTYRQLEKFAKKVRAPFGYLLLDSPPSESLPLPDFRSIKNASVEATPDLLAVIHDSQRKQAWYREHLQEQGALSLEFVGEVETGTDPVPVAKAIRRALRLDDVPLDIKNAGAARKDLVERVEELGVLVLVNGVVGNNTKRPLDVEEFRGFAIADDLAPLIFVNGRDSLTAQCFTVAHELAHIWAGQSAISDADQMRRESTSEEAWANEVAAEVLVPASRLRAVLAAQGYRPGETPDLDLARAVACEFGVSPLVVFRRLVDLGAVTWDAYLAAYETAVVDGGARKQTAQSGGDFYRTQRFRVGVPLVRAVVQEAREGRTLYRDAYALLGVSSRRTFDEMERKFGA